MLSQKETAASLGFAGRYSLYFAFLWCYLLPTAKSELLALNNQLVFGPRGCRGGSHSGERELCGGVKWTLEMMQKACEDKCTDLTGNLWEHFANRKRENPIFHNRKVSQPSCRNAGYCFDSKLIGTLHLHFTTPGLLVLQPSYQYTFSNLVHDKHNRPACDQLNVCSC